MAILIALVILIAVPGLRSLLDNNFALEQVSAHHAARGESTTGGNIMAAATLAR